MNIKNIIFGLACVLAVTAAAQPARAQNEGHTEQSRRQASAYHMAGPEMKKVNSSEYAINGIRRIGKKCLKGICQAAQTAAQNYAEHGMGGREGAVTRGGEYWADRISHRNAEREAANTLQTVLEKKAAQAANKARRKEKAERRKAWVKAVFLGGRYPNESQEAYKERLAAQGLPANQAFK